MNVWIEAARPRTLAAGVVPVVVGTAASERFILWRFMAALIVGVSIQIGVNYANDYFDGVRGVDTSERVGPRRAVASGMVSPTHMRIAMILAFAACAVAGSMLAIAVNPVLLVVGALSFVAALGYSGGPRPYASAGFGEVFVFVFFGLVATAGSAYVQDERLRAVPIVTAIPVGLLATALLVVNNLRDESTDRAAGKHTLAVRLGAEATARFYDACLLAALGATALVAAADRSPWALIALGAAPIAYMAHNAVASHDDPRGLIAALGSSARLQFIFGGLMAGGLWIS